MDAGWLAKFGSIVTLGGGVWFLFDKAEAVIRPSVRRNAFKWLRNLDSGITSKTWPATFTAIFDSVFGEHHFSWRCIWRSCFASLAGLSVLMLLWMAFQLDEVVAFFGQVLFFGEGWFPEWPGLLMVLLLVMLNLLPDYISLLETRLILLWMSQKPSGSRICTLLVVDLILTGFIFCFALLCWVAWSEGAIPSWKTVWESVLQPIFNSLFHSDDDLGLGILFCSTYFTSVWVWLYAFSGGAVRAFGFVVGIVRIFLDIERAPVRSIGLVASVFSSMLLIVAFVVTGIWQAISDGE